ncbi:MAG: 4Fe-4S binding protein [Anaerolineales bacterium]|nr:4Fe-4S binding protein [Anaerolineales bacterium]
MHRWFPGVLQALALLVFVALTVVGWQGATDETRYTNLGNLAIWVIWWPALIFVALFAARIWGTVCPIGFVTRHLGRFSLQLKVPRRIRKHKLAIVLGLFLLHSIIISYHVHHVPRLTAVYLLVLMGYGIAISLLFEKDAFCSAFCPLNGIIGTYAMLSPTELRSKNRETCKSCQAHACLDTCPRNLYMGAAESSESCLLCFDCVKACPENNVSFRLRKPLQGLWQRKNHTLPNALIVTILLGIIIEEVGEEWARFEEVTTAVPNALVQWGVPASLFGYDWLIAAWLNFLLPLLVLGVAALFARLLAGKGRVTQLFQRYALGFVPLVFSLHLAKMWHKFNTKLTLLPYAADDPGGQLTAAGLSTKTLASPPALMGSSVEGILLLLLLIAGLAATLYAIAQIARAETKPLLPRRGAIPFHATAVLLAAVFAVTIVNWFGLFGS